MPQTVLITGSTNGIGLATARHLASRGHALVLHGRDRARLDDAAREVEAERSGAVAATLVADLGRLADVAALAAQALESVPQIDVLVNNAGVLRTSSPVTDEELDVRFVVNAIAPYLLTRRLLPAMPGTGRVVNVSSAAQAPVDLDALAGRVRLDDMTAYSQSKLALTMWSRHLALELGDDGPVMIAVNPGSLLATRMVREGFGIAGNDIGLGVDSLTRAAVGGELASATGEYFDGDTGRLAAPHPDALDDTKAAAVVAEMDRMLEDLAAR